MSSDEAEFQSGLATGVELARVILDRMARIVERDHATYPTEVPDAFRPEMAATLRRFVNATRTLLSEAAADKKGPNTAYIVGATVFLDQALGMEDTADG